MFAEYRNDFYLIFLFHSSYNFQTNSVDKIDGETTFNALFIFPFLDAVTRFLAESVEWCKAGFRHGVAPLQSMAQQLKQLRFYDSESHCYLADGVIKLYGLKGLEILLLETSGCFENTDRPKISFDHHKGLFGALSMLKTLADKFSKASVETFCKTKVLFIHAAGEKLFMWGMRYEPKGPIFELWLESILHIKADMSDRLEFLPACLNFFWVMKCLLYETIRNIGKLKQKHFDFLLKNSMSSVTLSSHNLSSIVDPSILKLTEEEDKAGLQKIGPFYDTS